MTGFTMRDVEEYKNPDAHLQTAFYPEDGTVLVSMFSRGKGVAILVNRDELVAKLQALGE